jgi:hypothetical protein
MSARSQHPAFPVGSGWLSTAVQARVGEPASASMALAVKWQLPAECLQWALFDLV